MIAQYFFFLAPIIGFFPKLPPKVCGVLKSSNDDIPSFFDCATAPYEYFCIAPYY